MTKEVKVTRSLGGGLVEITMRRSSVCAVDCRDCAGCPHPEEWITAPALNKAGASVGDSVTVESGSGAVLSLAALTYLVPAVLLVAGCILGGIPAETYDIPALQALTGLLALAAGVLLILPVNKRLRRKTFFTVVNITDPSGTE